MPYKSSSAASDAALAPFGLRIIRAMQPSVARAETVSASGSSCMPATGCGESFSRNAIVRARGAWLFLSD
jgi:hypothetical protein